MRLGYQAIESCRERKARVSSWFLRRICSIHFCYDVAHTIQTVAEAICTQTDFTIWACGLVRFAVTIFTSRDFMHLLHVKPTPTILLKTKLGKALAEIGFINAFGALCCSWWSSPRCSTSAKILYMHAHTTWNFNSHA